MDFICNFIVASIILFYFCVARGFFFVSRWHWFVVCRFNDFWGWENM